MPIQMAGKELTDAGTRSGCSLVATRIWYSGSSNQQFVPICAL